MTWRPRHGQWVKFKADRPLPMAHRTADGYCVGIFQRGGRRMSAVAHAVAAATGEPVPAAAAGPPADVVVVVNEFGENAIDLVRGQVAADEIDLAPAGLTDLRPVTDRADIPAARLAHLPADWQPTP